MPLLATLGRTLLESVVDGVYGIGTRGLCTFLNRSGAEMLGYAPEEAIGKNMHALVHHHRSDGSELPETECPIQRALTAGESCRIDEDVFWRKDGTPFPVQYSASPIVDNGQIRGALITFSDITARKQAERRILVQHDVSRVMAESATLEEARPGILEAIGQNLGWELGALWTVHRRRGVLRCTATWHEPRRSCCDFDRLSREMAFARNSGVHGSMWADGKPVWIPDLAAEPNFPRLRLAGLEDIRSMFAFPLRSGRRIVGAVEFFSKEIRQPDPDLLRTVTTLGNQIGDFIERASGEEELRVRDRAIASSRTGIVITDALQPENPTVYVNPAFERITGYSAEDALGKNCRFLQGQETDPAAIAEIREAIRTHRECSMVLLNYRKDGTPFWNDLTIAPVPDESGRVTHFVGQISDVTERRHAEDELRRAKEAAEVASRAKSQFLANMSHELRTPLNAIIGYSEMLAEESEDGSAPEMAADLGKIHTAGQHLLALINEILDLSKIEAGRMDLYVEPFEICTLVREVAATVQPLIDKNGNALEVSCPGGMPQMRTDQTKLRQSLFNLLSNASKFTANGRIQVDVQAEDRAGKTWVVLRVSDTGIGMAPEEMAHLFEPFSQVNAGTTRKYGGTGLGLALTRRFCRMMGGEVLAESRKGEGSVFTIELPAELEKPRAGHAHPRQPGCTVLVIDDDANSRELIERYLARDGFDTVSASSGEEGLRLARELHPMAITLDVMMPRMDGWAVLSTLKADPSTAGIPVIMATIVDDRNLGYMLGAADYLTKPVNRDQLAAVLQKYRCITPPCPVLLVEDDEVTRGMMRSMLEREGWHVVEAANGQEALERMRQARPTVILLDLMMPEMDGFEFLVEQRANPEWRDIPVVVITAKQLTEEERAALNGSAQRVLLKGAFSREELLAKVRELVSACAGQPV